MVPRRHTMIVLFHLGISCLFFWADAIDLEKIVTRTDNTDFARGINGEAQFVEKQTYQQDEVPVVQRGSQQSNNQYTTCYPSYVTAFIEAVADSKALLECHSQGFSCISFPDYVVKYLAGIGQTDPQKLGTFQTTPALTITYSGPTKHLEANTKKFSAYMFRYKDPEWGRQWEMQDYRTSNIPVMDHSIVPVHNLGYTGASVTIAILGEGIREHRDLGDNYIKDMSYDFCNDARDQYPTYRLTFSGYSYSSEGNYHAGIIAMHADNGVCGVGIAPKASIAAYKMSECEPGVYYRKKDLGSTPLHYQSEKIDIYCNIWTPNDEQGQYIIPITKEIENAFITGLTEGRNRYGSVYVYPSGRNRAHSNCAMNGYINNPYVITIASANQQGKPASYSERCSAVFATAYSGDVGMEGLGTIDANGQCATTPSDLPVASAVAAGIIALLLESKNSLTYRDVMHIIAMTAEVAPLADNPDTWLRNARGFWVSRDFGFGLLNAENMVNLAKNWQKLPKGRSCLLRKNFDKPLYFDHKESKKVIIDASACQKGSFGVTFVEHVKLEFSASYLFRGAIYLNLTSPAGTTITILDPRVKDFSTEGYKQWNIMATQFWGENPRGPWTVTVNALEIYDTVNPHGYVEGFILKLYGLQDTPKAYPRKYAAFRLPNGQTNLHT